MKIYNHGKINYNQQFIRVENSILAYSRKMHHWFDITGLAIHLEQLYTCVKHGAGIFWPPPIGDFVCKKNCS